MQAIEMTGKINSQGQLQLDQPLNNVADRKVRVIVLLSEPEDDIDEQSWREAAAKNPSFAFLYDEEEDIYTSNDGKPVSDQG